MTRLYNGERTTVTEVASGTNEQKKVRFSPLYTFGIRTGPPSVKPNWLNLKAGRVAAKDRPVEVPELADSAAVPLDMNSVVAELLGNSPLLVRVVSVHKGIGEAPYRRLRHRCLRDAWSLLPSHDLLNQ